MDPFLVTVFDESPTDSSTWVNELLAAIERAGSANLASKARAAFRPLSASDQRLKPLSMIWGTRRH